jgi:hypothetical protein
VLVLVFYLHIVTLTLDFGKSYIRSLGVLG